MTRFTGSTPAGDKALRFGPSTRYIRPDEAQFLTFLNARSAEQAGTILRFTLTFDDASTLVKDNLVAPQTLPVGQKITYPVGPVQRNLAALVPNGRTLNEYTVQRVAANGTTALSVAYRFVLNYAYSPYVRYFAYLNSLGCVDTLCTTGKGSEELNRFYEQAERYLAHAYDVQDGQFVDYDLATQQQVEVTTGFWPQAVLQTWNDFYRSPNRFRLQDGRALPISITSKSIKQAKDGDTLFAHRFEFIYLYKDDFYTYEVPEAGDGVPPKNFKPGGGQVIIQQPTLIRSVDDTVPDAARELTADLLNKLQIVAARPNPETLGFLSPQNGALLFRRTDQPVPYSSLSDKPTTRDEAGLTDVPTVTEVASLNAGGLRQPAPEVSDNTTTASSAIVFVTLVDEQGHEYREARPMDFATLAQFVFQNASPEQKADLLAQLKPTLDNVLEAGPESNRTQIVRESNRRSISLVETLPNLRGWVFDANQKLYVDRAIQPDDLARQLLDHFDYAALAEAIAPYLNLPSTPPSEFIFGSLVTCEDSWKDMSRDDFDNADFQ